VMRKRPEIEVTVCLVCLPSVSMAYVTAQFFLQDAANPFFRTNHAECKKLWIQIQTETGVTTQFSLTILSYGRFSKSVRPDECGQSLHMPPSSLLPPSLILHSTVCGVCKVGRLNPKFTREGRPKQKQTASKLQGTPKVLIASPCAF
jgi:hypothetical protein